MAKRFDAVRLIFGAPRAALIGLVRFYQIVLSPVKFAILGPASRCRFEPSCSGYAIQALRRHGLFRGSWLALRRLARCHPWGDFGPDPVPPAPVRASKDSNVVSGPVSDKRAFGLCACVEKTEKSTQPEAALRCC